MRNTSRYEEIGSPLLNDCLIFFAEQLKQKISDQTGNQTGCYCQADTAGQVLFEVITDR
jgi:hypothetical protein